MFPFHVVVTLCVDDCCWLQERKGKVSVTSSPQSLPLTPTAIMPLPLQCTARIPLLECHCQNVFFLNPWCCSQSPSQFFKTISGFLATGGLPALFTWLIVLQRWGNVLQWSTKSRSTPPTSTKNFTQNHSWFTPGCADKSLKIELLR